MTTSRRRPLLHLTVSRAARAVVDSLPARTAAESISRLIVGRAAELRRHAQNVLEERAEPLFGDAPERLAAARHNLATSELTLEHVQKALAPSNYGPFRDLPQVSVGEAIEIAERLGGDEPAPGSIRALLKPMELDEITDEDIEWARRALDEDSSE